MEPNTEYIKLMGDKFFDIVNKHDRYTNKAAEIYKAALEKYVMDRTIPSDYRDILVGTLCLEAHKMNYEKAERRWNYYCIMLVMLNQISPNNRINAIREVERLQSSDELQGITRLAARSFGINMGDTPVGVAKRYNNNDIKHTLLNNRGNNMKSKKINCIEGEKASQKVNEIINRLAENPRYQIDCLDGEYLISLKEARLISNLCSLGTCLYIFIYDDRQGICSEDNALGRSLSNGRLVNKDLIEQVRRFGGRYSIKQACKNSILNQVDTRQAMYRTLDIRIRELEN